MTAKNAILLTIKPDFQVISDGLMTYDEAVKLMENYAISEYLIQSGEIDYKAVDIFHGILHYIKENCKVEDYKNKPGLLITPYTACVFCNKENVVNYKIIFI